MSIKSRERIERKKSIHKISYSNASKRYQTLTNRSLRKASIFNLKNNVELHFNFKNKVSTDSIFATAAHGINQCLYIEQGRCNITDYASAGKFYWATAPKKLILMGGRLHNINLRNWGQEIVKDDINLMYLDVIVKSEVNNYTLDIFPRKIFTGTITKENYYVNIQEDSFLLRDGTMLSLGFFRKLIVDYDTFQLAENYFKTLKKEFAEIHNEAKEHNENLWQFSKERFESWEKELEKIQASLAYKNHIKNKDSALTGDSEVLSAPLKYDLSKHQKIINDFNSYQTDLVKMMEKPALSNLQDKVIQSFNIYCLQIQEGEIKVGIAEFKAEWLRILSYADTQSLSHFNNNQFKKFNDSKNILSKALDEASTDNEKESSVKALERALMGVLPVNESVINNLKQQIGLKELH